MIIPMNDKKVYDKNQYPQLLNKCMSFDVKNTGARNDLEYTIFQTFFPKC